MIFDSDQRYSAGANGAITPAQFEIGRLLLGVGTDHSQQQSYEAGQKIADAGVLSPTHFHNPSEFDYCKVPFGLITEGIITVYENGVGVRQLKAGDCIGGFETAHWLKTGSNRQIGRWTLVATEPASVLFLGRGLLLGSDNNAPTHLATLITDAAIFDHVPQPVTGLDLLDWTAAHTTSGLLEDTAVIVHSHILPTNVLLMRHLAHLVDKQNLYILEKPYSTQPESQHRLVEAGVHIVPVPMGIGDDYANALERSIHVLWRKITEAAANGRFNKLLILDDGGDLWATIPHAELGQVRIAGVEQTARGLARFRKSSTILPPIVSVASSGVKKIVESEIIADAVVRKLCAERHVGSGVKIGVIGTGNIGRAVLRNLKCLGHQAFCYDGKKPTDMPPEDFRHSLDALIGDADLIIGCTGVDILQGVMLKRLMGNKKFVSASSADIEFGTLLRFAKTNAAPFDDVVVSPHQGLNCTLLNGGFPFNFDRAQEWEAPEDIALTRCLLYFGMMQAANMLDEPHMASRFVALDTHAQEQILAEWLARRQKAGVTVDDSFKNVSSIAQAVFVDGLSLGPTCWIDNKTQHKPNLVVPKPDDGLRHH